MRAAIDGPEAGRRVEEVLDRLAATGDRAACAAAEELVRVLMDFYGTGLARIVEKVGAGPLKPVYDDELVASLLSLHGLHPEDVHTRIGRALAAHGEPVELLGFDADTGVLRLRPAASTGCGCGSGSGGQGGAARTLEDTLACFAPEVTSVEREPAAAPAPALLQIGTRPPSPARVP
ncbi:MULTISPECIES: hypothetical protein [Streptomyces]|uniref:Thioredoxin n=1 Tax=Streptomyces spororaveus TaxID=284039 RepID=A0ABQ3T8X5_9ACTN|nr:MULTISPECIES: hypothetical protein [Streptomyces]MCM9082725.1 hypothetical protein [Streptomyces spororaveus]MCX5302506.1 hypothetical protein [Streptomyces sp. NBC_00160]GHI76849.1 thioredoxin [Streptomyces spororaveus]